MGLILRMLADFELIAYNNIWTPACIFAACFVALLYSNRKAANTKNKVGFIMVAVTTVVAIGYGYGVCVFYNCYYDHSVPQKYHVKVLSKTHSSTIANNSYYLKIGPWGPVGKQDEYLVNAELYDDISAGDTVKLYLKQGKLHAPWVQITR
ncbi:MAG TPA: hypothetical protein VK154_09930 [Chitinophagales bacterium]|nr:hypothetical protein [Chitinophagales bacterium]